MEVLINAIGIVNLIITAITFLFKDKRKILICFFVYDICLIAQYIFSDRLTETIVCVIATIKVLVYLFFDVKKIEPKLYVVLIFELLLIVTGIMTWENWFSLLFMFAVMITTFASWQNNNTIMRLAYIVAGLLCVVNYIFTGLYTMILSECISIGSAVVGIFLYDIFKVQNREKGQKIESKTDL